MRHLIPFLTVLLYACAADSAPRGDIPEQVEVDTSMPQAEIAIGDAHAQTKAGPQWLELSWSSFVTHQALNADLCNAWGWGAPCVKNRTEREAYYRDYNGSGQWRTIAGMRLELGWENLGYNDYLPAPWVYMVCITGLWCQDASNARNGVFHGWDGVSYGQGWMQVEVYMVAPAGTTSTSPKMDPRATVLGLYVY